MILGHSPRLVCLYSGMRVFSYKNKDEILSEESEQDRKSKQQIIDMQHEIFSFFTKTKIRK